MLILAIDPGYDRLGIAIIKKEDRGKEELLFSECFSPSKKIAREKRITEIGKRTNKLIKKWSPDAVILEDLFFSNNQKTALSVAEVRGVLIYESQLAKIALYQFKPSQIKMAVTGNGRSDKRQVETMVKKLIDLNGKKPKYDDEFDAIALGLTFFACRATIPK